MRDFDIMPSFLFGFVKNVIALSPQHSGNTGFLSSFPIGGIHD